MYSAITGLFVCSINIKINVKTKIYFQTIVKPNKNLIFFYTKSVLYF